MSVKIKYHGILGDVAGRRSENFENVNSVGLLKKTLYARYREMKDFIFIMAVNGIVAGDKVEIKKGDHIDIIPQMPGG